MVLGRREDPRGRRKGLEPMTEAFDAVPAAWSRRRRASGRDEGRIPARDRLGAASPWTGRSGEVVPAHRRRARPCRARGVVVLAPEGPRSTSDTGDDHLLVVSKPAGFRPTRPRTGGQTPGEPGSSDAGALAPRGGPLRPGIVHRLDAGTRRLVVASDDQTSEAPHALFERHDVERRYLALVRGAVPHERRGGRPARTPRRADPDRRHAGRAAAPPSGPGAFRRATLLEAAPRPAGHINPRCISRRSVNRSGRRRYGGGGDHSRELGLDRRSCTRGGSRSTSGYWRTIELEAVRCRRTSRSAAAVRGRLTRRGVVQRRTRSASRNTRICVRTSSRRPGCVSTSGESAAESTTLELGGVDREHLIPPRAVEDLAHFSSIGEVTFWGAAVDRCASVRQRRYRVRRERVDQGTSSSKRR